MDTAYWVKRLKRESGLTRYRLAKETGVNEATIRSWEAGQSPVGPKFSQFLEKLGYELVIQKKK